jgi:hypothetical protein
MDFLHYSLLIRPVDLHAVAGFEHEIVPLPVRDNLIERHSTRVHESFV